MSFVEQGDYLDIHFFENIIKKDVEEDSTPRKEKPEKNGFAYQHKAEGKPEKKEESKNKLEKTSK